MTNLKGKNGIIFGSTGLLGNKITEELSKLDANLILQGTSIKKLKNLDNKMKSMKKKPILFHANVLNKEFYEKLLEIVSSRFNKLDILINLIGQFSTKTIDSSFSPRMGSTSRNKLFIILEDFKRT